MSASIAYRPDVDGLRAVAVLSVVFGHFAVPGFSGGYVGVDVFFVISGFLITSIVVRDIASSSYSLRAFYERRARRILPALLVVVLVSAVAALELLLPEDLLGFGKSLLASATFSTNLLFWQEGGYFAAPSELKPLLHTWSLSLEEQFYLFFPLLLSWVSRRAPRLLTAVLLSVLCLSLALCVWATGRREFAFYILPSRAWELMAGALLAVIGRPARLSARWATLLGLAGLLAIVVSVATFSSQTVFPGLAAVLPTFGASALILSGPDRGPAAWLLARPPPVFIGKISYSLYLWHWPLLVFAKYYFTRSLSAVQVAALIATAVVLATLSWRFVETPFRRSSQLNNNTKALALAGVSLLGIAVVGAALVLGRGFPTRVPVAVLEIANHHQERPRAKPGCTERILRSNAAPPGECLLGAPGATPSFALWGDSHGEAVSGGLADEAERHGRSGILLSKLGCPPLFAVDIAQGLAKNSACRNFATRAFEYIESSSALERVVIVGRWSLYINGQMGADPGRSITQMLMGANPLLLDPRGDPTTPERRAGLFEAALRRGVERLRSKGKRVFVSDPIPEIGWDVPMTLARASWFGAASVGRGPTLGEYEARNRLALTVLEKLAREGLITRLSPQAVLCTVQGCRIYDGATILYADGDHVSLAGSKLIGPAYRAAVSD
jgi:peptidoglycan/LPS O-acetylase OafA/YrhL